MKEISLTVTVDEGNLLLQGLSQMPYAKVYALVAKLQQQAGSQLNGEDERAEGGKLDTTPPDAGEQVRAR